MPTGIYKRTEETKRKMSEAHKGKTSGILGKHFKHKEETKKKISVSHKGKSSGALGKRWKLSNFTKQKMSKRRTGKKLSEEHKRKISENNKRRYIKYPELRKKIAEKLKGEKSHLWKGGISFEPYSVNWTNTLRRSIRERDKYTCQICDKEPSIHCHHIDYNKLNCNPENLITLCGGCHLKTNFNRNYWINYFKNLKEITPKIKS